MGRRGWRVSEEMGHPVFFPLDDSTFFFSLRPAATDDKTKMCKQHTYIIHHARRPRGRKPEAINTDDDIYNPLHNTRRRTGPDQTGRRKQQPHDTLAIFASHEQTLPFHRQARNDGTTLNTPFFLPSSTSFLFFPPLLFVFCSCSSLGWDKE